MRKLAYMFLFAGLLHTCSGNALAQRGLGGAEGGAGGVEPAGPAQAPGEAAPTAPKFSGTFEPSQPNPASRNVGSVGGESAVPGTTAIVDPNQPGSEGGGDLNAVINPNKTKPKTLEEAIQRALTSNPDIALAEANLRQAQAAYEQAKLKVTNQVMIAMEKAEVDRLELDRVKMLREKGVVSEEVLRGARFESRKSELELDYLLGVTHAAGRAGLPEHFLTPGMKWGTLLDFHQTLGSDAGGGAPSAGRTGGMVGAEGTGGGAAPAPSPQDHIRDALKLVNGPVEFKEMPLPEFAEYMAKMMGPPVIVDRQAFIGTTPEAILITLKLSNNELTWNEIVQAVSDTHDVGFLVRDYGILITTPNKAAIGNLGGGGLGGGGGMGGGAMPGGGGGFF